MRLRIHYLILILALFLAACGGAAGVEEAAINVDEESGLLINPDDREQPEPFIVEGTIRSMNLIPASKPEFLILADGGRQFRVNPQPVGEIYFDDGSLVETTEFQLGMAVRATVTFDPEMNGGLGGLLSEDLILLK